MSPSTLSTSPSGCAVRESIAISSPCAMICSGVCGVTVTRSRIRHLARAASSTSAICASRSDFAHRVLRRGQQRHREQVDRVHVGGAVDVHLDLLRGRVDRVADSQSGRSSSSSGVPSQAGACAASMSDEPDRLAEIHDDLAVVAAQHARDAHQQLPDRFLLLRLADQLVEVAVAFDQLLVADVDRLEQHRPRGLAQERAHRHRDHAALRRQQAARARAPAFDEVLERVAARDQLRHVFGEHRRIQRVAAEAAAQEERAAAAQHRPDHRQVEVDARGDVRRHDALGVEQVAQQQVVHVAAVAGHVDDFVAGRVLLERVEVVHQHAAVDAVPHQVEQEARRAHHRMRVVGGDLVDVGVRLLPGFGLALLAVRRILAARLVGDGFLHRFGGQHLVGEQAARRQVGPDHRRADAAEMRAQHARELAHACVPDRGLPRPCRARDTGGANCTDVRAAVEQDREQAAEAADDRPVFREQHREPAAVLVRRAADEDRDGHELHVERRIGRDAPAAGARANRSASCVPAPAQAERLQRRWCCGARARHKRACGRADRPASAAAATAGPASRHARSRISAFDRP